MTTTGPSSNTGVCSSLVDREHVHFTKPPVNANYCFMSHFSLFLDIFMGYSHTHRYIRVHISLDSPSLQLQTPLQHSVNLLCIPKTIIVHFKKKVILIIFWSPHMHSFCVWDT